MVMRMTNNSPDLLGSLNDSYKIIISNIKLIQQISRPMCKNQILFLAKTNLDFFSLVELKMFFFFRNLLNPLR